MLIAESTLSHIRKLNGPLGAGIHEPVAHDRMELGCRDDLRQLLHVRRLDVDNIKALVLDIQVPQINPQIVTANKRLPVGVYRYAVDVIGMGVGVGSTRNGGDNGIMMRHAGELQRGGILEREARWSRRTTSACDIRGCQVAAQVILRNHLERLIKHLPQLDGLVVCREEIMGRILPSAPFDLVDLFFDF